MCHLVDWLVVRVFYTRADFTVLNAVKFSGFVTLSLRHLIAPQQVRHWFITKDKRCVFELLLHPSLSSVHT